MRRPRPQLSRRNRRWSAPELDLLRRQYPDRKTSRLAAELGRPTPSVYAQAHSLGLRKSAAFLASPDACRLTGETGRASRFPPGHVPWNAGKHYVAGGRSAQTRFRPGNVSARWDPQVYCVGALRVNSDGGLDIKLRPGGRSWVAMSRWVWESERGPIPRGQLVRAINGDPHDARIENLRLASRREVMRENSFWNYPRPLAEVIQLRAALIRKLKRRKKNERENHHASA